MKCHRMLFKIGLNVVVGVIVDVVSIDVVLLLYVQKVVLVQRPIEEVAMLLLYTN